MAVFLPVALVGLATRYLCYKVDFIRFSRVPKPFGTALNQKAISILKGTLIARAILSVYMYGADNIFLTEVSTIAGWVFFS